MQRDNKRAWKYNFRVTRTREIPSNFVQLAARLTAAFYGIRALCTHTNKHKTAVTLMRVAFLLTLLKRLQRATFVARINMPV